MAPQARPRAARDPWRSLYGAFLLFLLFLLFLPFLLFWRAAHQPTSITTAIQDSAHFVTYATGTRQP
jgi:hypothetical protein